MSRYELVFFPNSIRTRYVDDWRDKIENIEGEIVEPIVRDGYTRGFVVDTEANSNNR